MKVKKITPAELRKLLSIYDVYKQEQTEDSNSVISLLSAIEAGNASRAYIERTFQPGEILMRENHPGDTFYIIRSGHAVVFKGDLQNPAILGFRGVGEAIGEMALLENLPRSATIIALDEMTLWEFSRETFYRFLQENPTFSMTLMNMLSSRIRKSDEERMRGYMREKKQVVALETLSRQATHDPLTGLFNRRYLDQILYGEIAHARQSGALVGVLMADVDHFKQVNDKYGHKAGDLMLQKAGELMKGCVRAADIVCRYGGEEFVIVMPGASETVVGKCAEEIRSRFEKSSVTFEKSEIRATMSLGAAIYPLHGATVDEVFINADRAMYRAKEGGRNRVVVFSAKEM
ncbi:MAG: GGDEF domain-containing protein [Chloroflexi bacterium]|nr:GGDEF domain-containing protein [Chloroflexota bacterium]